jgi:hypothetical protein
MVMNWDLFTATLSIGLVTALISLNRTLTPLEAWLLVASRIVAAGVLAWLMPERVTGPVLVALALWETARVTAALVAYMIQWRGARREADRWLQRHRQAETQRATSPKGQRAPSGP